MNYYTKQHIARDYSKTFKSFLRDSNLIDSVESSKDRTQNQVIWINHKPGDLIFAQHTRELMMVINSEVQKRNTALKNNSAFESNGYYNNSQIIRNNIALADPLIFAQEVFKKYLSDDLPQLQLPKELKNLQESSCLVISYRSALARLPYNFSSAKIDSNNIIIKLEQSYNYYDLRDLETNSKLDDLFVLRDLLKDNPEKQPSLGVIKESGDFYWFNNLKVSNIIVNEKNEVIGDLIEKPQDWTEDIGYDANSEQSGTIGANLLYAKSRKSVLEKSYEENIEWQSVKKTYSIELTLSYDAALEELVDGAIEGAIITAERLNKFKEYTNKLSSACICNCNYCTCDCNYCTCDCNYCTCNCNYCTCNCNYCTCNCNYKYIDPENSAKQYPTITQFTKNICTCDTNRNEYLVIERYKRGKGWYNWCYRMEWGERRYWKTDCPSNRSFLTNSDKSIWMAPHANIELSCVCDSNYTENNYKTSFFANSTDNTEFVKDGSQEIPDLHPSFSTAETYADGEFVDTRKKTKNYQICTCDVNTKLQETEIEYYDVSDYYECTCNADKNPNSGIARYKFALNSKAISEGYADKSKFPQGKKSLKYKEAQCPANREIQSLVDWTQFWDSTAYKAGKETK